MYVWTGFDYIGEPTPYPMATARSSYFRHCMLTWLVFQKMFIICTRALFTTKNVLHLFPHWNWQPNQTIDMWAYYNNAD